MNDSERVAERRIELSLPIVEGAEAVPDHTRRILARLRAEGLLEAPARRGHWVAAAVLVLGVGVAIGVAAQHWAAPEAAGTGAWSQEPGGGLPRIALEPPPAGRTPGNAWFPTTELDLGTVYQFEAAQGTFSFRNPTDRPRQLTDLRQSCNCTRSRFRIGARQWIVEPTAGDPNTLFEIVDRGGVASRERRYAIEVGPGQAGTVEVQMELSGHVGPRHATVAFALDDPDLPAVTLSFQALGAEYFQVSPKEVDLGVVRWDETRSFEVDVTSKVVDDFRITAVENTPPGMELSYTRTRRAGRPGYAIRGTYRPAAGHRAGQGAGGRVVFRTDRQDLVFHLPVVATVEGPLVVEPGFVALGLIRQGATVRRTVRLAPRAPFDLRVVALEPRELSFDPRLLRVSWRPVGSGAVEVLLEVTGDLPPGTVVRGEVRVGVNHPAVEAESLLFNGFVR